MVCLIVSEIESVRMRVLAEELRVNILEDRLDDESSFTIKPRHIVMKEGNRTFQELRGVDESESAGYEGVHHCMPLDLTVAIERTDIEGILAHQVTGKVRFPIRLQPLAG